MSDLFETVEVKGVGLTVPLLVFRRYGKPVAGLVERILAINPGLADLSPILPVGTVFSMPVADEATAPTSTTPVLEPIRLW